MSNTPGPWNYEEPGWDGLPHLTAANGDVVATFFSEPKNSDDMSLIAAAPELYEALKAAYMVLTAQKTKRKEHMEAVELARGAIAKVRGDDFDEAEYRRLWEAKKANALSPQEEERLIQLYEEGEVDDVPSVFLHSAVQQKMDSLIKNIDKLIQEVKAREEEDGGG